MSLDGGDVLIRKEYTVVSVEKTEAPEGGDGGEWYRYVVGRDKSTIVGNMRGTLQQVTHYAKEFVENLNSRTGVPKVRSAWVSSTKK